MFIGEYSHNFREKGRVGCAGKIFVWIWKQGAGVVTRGLDNCLVLFYHKGLKNRMAEVG
jgi:DNA-binding transcriptional regulator/RsmH inhibitor MraZ